jgi:cytidine deaminase
MSSIIQIAHESSKNAYNPYSGLSIGCALRTRNGKIYEGINIENSVFGLTMCAERVAVVSINLFNKRLLYLHKIE